MINLVEFWKEEKLAHNIDIADKLSTNDNDDVAKFLFGLRCTGIRRDRIEWLTDAVKTVWQICLSQEAYEKLVLSDKLSGYAIRRGGTSGFYALSQDKSETKKWGRWQPTSTNFEKYIDENITYSMYVKPLKFIFGACAPIYDVQDLKYAHLDERVSE